MNRLTIEDVQWKVDFYKRNPEATDHGQDIEVYSQLLDTMRENERLKAELIEWEKIAQLTLSISNLRKRVDSCKHTEVPEHRLGNEHVNNVLFRKNPLSIKHTLDAGGGSPGSSGGDAPGQFQPQPSKTTNTREL